MRDPLKLNYVIDDGLEMEIVEILNPRPFDIPDYDLLDEKDSLRYIYDIERMCRNSYEYKSLIKALKEDPYMNECGIYNSVRPGENRYNKISIDIHHEPFSLFDIASIVVAKRLGMNQPMEIELVSKEVMYNHYKLTVGLFPASKTVHQLIHNNYRFIPLQNIFGNVEAFVEEYKEFINDSYMEIYENIKKFSKVYDNDDNTILKEKYIYINTTERPPQEELYEFANYLRTNIDNIRHNIQEGFIQKEPNMKQKRLYEPITLLCDDNT